jgi:hypothetical protein
MRVPHAVVILTLLMTVLFAVPAAAGDAAV